MILDSVITASLTVIIGVTVYALSQIVSKFLIEPIHKQDEIRGEIADSLLFYANIYCNPGSGTEKEMNEASRVLRQKATLLRSRTCLIRWYGFFSWLKIVPKIENINEACGKLVGLSSSTKKGDAVRNYQWAEDIKERLMLEKKPREVAYPKVGKVLRLIPFLAFVDCVSTIFALSFGGREAFPLPAFFIAIWGNLGLVFYSILIFLILQLVSRLLIIRPLRLTAKTRPRGVSLFLQLFVIVLYYGGFSYWLSIVTMNFLYPIDLGNLGSILPPIIVSLSALVLFSYTRAEIVNLIKRE